MKHTMVTMSETSETREEAHRNQNEDKAADKTRALTRHVTQVKH